MLRVMMSSHSGIYIPPESDFIPRLFLGRHDVPMTRAQAERDIRIVLGYKRFFREWRAAPIEPERFVEALPELTPSAFLDALYSAYAEQHGADRWGDKSPIYTNYIGLLSHLFPEAQIVHLIRDGRDAALSALDAYRDRFYVDIYFAARTWRARVEAARRAGRALGPSRYIEVRYEALTADPETELRSLCAFLGEPFDPAMCEPHRLGRELLRPRGRHAPVRQPPRANSGRWQREMTAADRRLFDCVAAPLLDELGYECSDAGVMSSGERARYAGLATKYRTLESGRRVLQTFGVFHPH